VTLQATDWIEVMGHNPTFGGESRVTSATLDPGAGGTVTLVAPRVVVDGGAVATTALLPQLFFGLALPGDAGGVITLRADQVLVRGGGRVDASSFTAESAGLVDVTAGGSIVVEGAGSSIASRTASTGIGGDVVLSAPHIQVTDGGELSAKSAPGDSDVRQIFASFGFDELVRTAPDPGELAGEAGSIRLAASELNLRRGSITTSATEANGGHGGDPGAGDGHRESDRGAAGELRRSDAAPARAVLGARGQRGVGSFEVQTRDGAPPSPTACCLRRRWRPRLRWNRARSLASTAIPSSAAQVSSPQPAHRGRWGERRSHDAPAFLAAGEFGSEVVRPTSATPIWRSSAAGKPIVSRARVC
jgi:hypothetical protein